MYNENEIKAVEDKMPSGICHICKMFVVINGHCVYTARLMHIHKYENIMIGYICIDCEKEIGLKQHGILVKKALLPFFNTQYEP